MNLQVSAVDVNGVAVWLSPDYGLAAAYTSGSGSPAVSYEPVTGYTVDCDDSQTLSLTATSTDAQSGAVQVRFGPDPAQWRWDNPAATVKPGIIPGTGTVTITIGRASEAPFDERPDTELLRASRNAEGVLTGTHLAGVRADRDPSRLNAHLIRGLSADPDAGVPVCDDPSSLIGDPSATGLSRFRVRNQPAAPLTSGRFILVEYGAAGNSTFATGQRFLAAVWSPFPLDHPPLQPTKVDFIVWYSPSTFRPNFTLVDYPYGARVIKSMALQPDIVLQPYIALAAGHLFGPAALRNVPTRAHRLVYQLLAANRKAVVVMPISPAGEWGPFEVAAGLYRFLLEIVMLLSSKGFSTARFEAYQPPASIGRVVVTGLSEGLTPASAFLTRGKTPDDRNRTKFKWSSASPTLWSSPNGDQMFADCFKEFWDIDSSFEGMAKDAFRARRAQMARWFSERPDRMLRVYHTQTTAGSWAPDPVKEPDPAFRSILRTVESSPASVQQRSSRTGDWAQQWNDGSSPNRWTIVLFSDSGSGDSTDGYVGGPNGLGVPDLSNPGKFLTGHEVIPRIAFGHAAASSGLSR